MNPWDIWPGAGRKSEPEPDPAAEPDQIRKALQLLGQHCAPLIDPAAFEQAAAGHRDVLVMHGIDPADKKALEAGMVASYQALCHLVASGSVVFGPAVAMLWMQTEIYRRWLDDELPVLTAADMLHLPGVD